MAYIGRGINNLSNAQILDTITFTNSAGPYNLEQGSAAFTPISPQALVISVDGVIQAPDSYTISSATITFGVSMASTLTNDFIVHNGVGIVNVPTDGSVTTAKIEDLAVTAGKLAATQDLSTKTITLPASVSGLGTGITNAQLAGSIDVTTKITGVVPTANLGSGTASSTTILYGDQTYKTEPAEYDDSVVQSNIAMLGFKVAVNGSLTRYNLVDQSIDEFYDTSGVDAAASVNEQRVASGSNFYYDGIASTSPTVTEDADSTGTDGLYTWYKWTDTGATGSYNTNTTQDHDYLVIAGGGGAGNSRGGGGGSGGYRTATGLQDLSTRNSTYTITVGDGGAAGSRWFSNNRYRLEVQLLHCSGSGINNNLFNCSEAVVEDSEAGGNRFRSVVQEEVLEIIPGQVVLRQYSKYRIQLGKDMMVAYGSSGFSSLWLVEEAEVLLKLVQELLVIYLLKVAMVEHGVASSSYDGSSITRASGGGGAGGNSTDTSYWQLVEQVVVVRCLALILVETGGDGDCKHR